MTIVRLADKNGAPLTPAEADGNIGDLAARTATTWMMEGLEPTLREGIGNPCELANFIGGTVAYRFVPGSTTEVFVNWDVPLNWAPGTDLHAAIHWSPGASTGTGNVRWAFEFVQAAVGGTFPPSSAFFYVNGAADGTAYKHIQSVSDPYPGAYAAPNMRFLIRVFRDGGHVSDTFPDDAFIVGVDFYYKVGKFGAPSFSPPYT